MKPQPLLAPPPPSSSKFEEAPKMGVVEDITNNAKLVARKSSSSSSSHNSNRKSRESRNLPPPVYVKIHKKRESPSRTSPNPATATSRDRSRSPPRRSPSRRQRSDSRSPSPSRKRRKQRSSRDEHRWEMLTDLTPPPGLWDFIDLCTYYLSFRHPQTLCISFHRLKSVYFACHFIHTHSLFHSKCWLNYYAFFDLYYVQFVTRLCKPIKALAIELTTFTVCDNNKLFDRLHK